MGRLLRPRVEGAYGPEIENAGQNFQQAEDAFTHDLPPGVSPT
jgi:hypothetical protein